MKDNSIQKLTLKMHITKSGVCIDQIGIFSFIYESYIKYNLNQASMFTTNEPLDW